MFLCIGSVSNGCFATKLARTVYKTMIEVKHLAKEICQRHPKTMNRIKNLIRALLETMHLVFKPRTLAFQNGAPRLLIHEIVQDRKLVMKLVV